VTRIEKKFRYLRENNQKALITYITAGDPDLGVTKQLVLEMEKQGADIVEIGIPYSDPVADGPVIQRAAQRALSKKMKIKDIMNVVRELREQTQVPLLYLVYFNCIFQYGVEKFISDCAKVGIDGLIIPDLPYEESMDVREIGMQYDVNIIPLIAPTSSGRIKKIVQNAKGFIYCISSTGVTGVRNNFRTDLLAFMNEIDKYTDIPKAIGFGISSPEHIRELKHFCDGLIVGSAIVKIVEKYKDSDELTDRIGNFVKELKKAL
jgi:tryptophan synthase alpha chain